MATPRIGILPQEERMAIIQGAQRLGLDPYEFGGFLSLESGPNMDPNIVGGAGGRHKGLIQFGQAEQQRYLKPGVQTRAGQMPAVLQYFQDRGYKPGMGIERAYATVLGGNPNVSLNAKDAFGTSVAGAASRFKKGGDLYENARRVLGDVPASSSVASASQPQQQQQEQPKLAGEKDPVLLMLAQQMAAPILQPLLEQQTQSTSPFAKFLSLFGAVGQ